MKKFSLLLVLFISLWSCKAYKEARALENCEFELQDVVSPRLAGISTKDKNSVTDLSFTDLAGLMNAYQNGKLNFTCKLNVKAYNKSQKNAALNRMDWKLGLDKLDVAEGTTNQRVEIPAGGSAIVPVDVNMNIAEAFSGKSAQEIADFVFGLDKSKFKVKVKPYFKVGGKQVPMPGYINVANKL